MDVPHSKVRQLVENMEDNGDTCEYYEGTMETENDLGKAFACLRERGKYGRRLRDSLPPNFTLWLIILILISSYQISPYNYENF